jgi:uncharacterized protein
MQSNSDVSGRGSAQGKGVKLSEMMPSNDQRKGDWILLPSGTEFYVLDPRAEEIHISDIAHNLAHNCRFHGSCRRHYSVAEHSLYVAHLLRHEPIVTQLQALLHDATEAYLPDLAPQVKVAIPQFKTLEECLWKEICRRFGIPAEKPFIIKAADMACLWPEFKQLLPPNRIPALDQNAQMLEDHFPQIIDEARKLKIHVLSPAKARRKFLHSFYQLLRQFERAEDSAGQREPSQQQLITAGRDAVE